MQSDRKGPSGNYSFLSPRPTNETSNEVGKLFPPSDRNQFNNISSDRLGRRHSFSIALTMHSRILSAIGRAINNFKGFRKARENSIPKGVEPHMVSCMVQPETKMAWRQKGRKRPRHREVHFPSARGKKDCHYLLSPDAHFRSGVVFVSGRIPCVWRIPCSRFGRQHMSHKKRPFK